MGVVLAVVMAITLGACGRAGGEAGSSRPQVAASFYPLQFVAEKVVGDDAEVTNLTPPGTEPHDLELTPRQVARISEADLLLYLGQGFQPSLEDAASEATGRAVDVLEGLDLAGAEEDGEHADEAEEADEEGEEEHGEWDPHVWLDPTRFAAVAEDVGTLLAEIDPDNADAYRERADDLARQLQDLNSEFEEGLANCERTEIVVSHDAFSYLAREYGLEQVSIAGIDPEAEPSPARVAEVADFAAEHGVTTIFFETLLSPAIAETIADEIGVTTDVLDPIEGPPENTDYFGAMRANLSALRTALGCS
jgi:zinc transport system substrate-binding protein